MSAIANSVFQKYKFRFFGVKIPFLLGGRRIVGIIARPFIVVHWHKDIALSRKEETPSGNRKLPYYSNVTILRNFLGSGSIILRILMLNYIKRLAENREEELCGTSLLVAFMIYE